MRYFVARMVGGRRTASALVAALGIWSLAAVVQAETIYRWRDAAGQVHFSNRTEGLPRHAEVVKLPELMVLSSAPRTVPRASKERVNGPEQHPTCASLNPYPLIETVTSRLEALQPDATPADLALFVAGEPVWYSSNTEVQVFPASAINIGAASDQAAIAYPASDACPQMPPLERYAVTSPVRGSSGLCGDFRRASEEIEIALSRNQHVAEPFQFAAAHYESLAEGGTGFARAPSNIPPWVVQAAAGQNAGLAAQVGDLLDELTVAREEIDRAATQHGCW